MSKPTWATAPTDDDVADATWFLTLLGEDPHRLDVDPVQSIYPAKDLLRASRLAALPKDNAGVRKWDARIRAGEVIPPVLLVAGTLDRPAVIAEGYHRVCAAYLRDEQTPVTCNFLTGADGH